MTIAADGLQGGLGGGCRGVAPRTFRCVRLLFRQRLGRRRHPLGQGFGDCLRDGNRLHGRGLARRLGRRRGLAARLSDIISYDDAGALALEAAGHAARALPGEDWRGRITGGSPDGAQIFGLADNDVLEALPVSDPLISTVAPVCVSMFNPSGDGGNGVPQTPPSSSPA